MKSESSGRRVGLFGGTFNPIHFGHLRGAEEIREAFQLEKVIFIPSSIPPHKGTEMMTEAKHRLEMVRLAISPNSYFSISDIELSRPGKSYTIDTLRFFREKSPAALFFILGKDAFMEIETWKEARHLFSFCDFIVMARPGSQGDAIRMPFPVTLISDFQYCPEEGVWTHLSGNRLYFKEISFLDISSTKVREMIEKGKSVRYLIPDEVEAYIQTYGLYRRNV